MSRLLVTCPLPDAVIERAVREFDATLSQDRTLSPQEMLGRLAQEPVEAVLLSSRTRLVPPPLRACRP